MIISLVITHSDVDLQEVDNFYYAIINHIDKSILGIETSEYQPPDLAQQI